MRGMSRVALVVLALMGCGGTVEEGSNAAADQEHAPLSEQERQEHIHQFADYVSKEVSASNLGFEEPGDESTVCSCRVCGKQHPPPCHLY